MIPENAKDLVDEPVIAVIASVRPDGQPQNSPTWFEWDGEHVRLSVTKDRQRPRNVAHEPRVSITMVDPQNPYRYLEVRGEVERIEDDVDYAFINSLAKRYLGMDEYPYHQPGDERIVLYVRPSAAVHQDPR